MTRPNDSSLFIEQARWLLEWHNKRSGAFTTRAVAVLGFDGVVLALLLQGAGLDGLKASWWTWIFLVASMLGLLLTGLFALLTIAAKPVAAPSVQQLRHWWGKHAAEPVAGIYGPQVAESLLNSGDITGVSAVSAAKEEADRRANRFAVCIWAMFGSVILIACLVTNVLVYAWGR